MIVNMSALAKSNFERYEMLLERQSMVKAERKEIKNSLELVDNKIKNLIHYVKNRPRESDEELVKKLYDVEVYHATHPQTNKDEREFMRELKVLKNKRKELVEYNIKQGEIDELKSQRSIYQRELKDKDLCLDELFAGTRKMRAAHKLNCDPNVLQEETMIVPEDKFRQVIGTGGSNVKKIEDECFVCIDMDRPRSDSTDGTLRLFYNPSSHDVDTAKRLIQAILDSRMEEWSLSPEKIACLLVKRAAIVMRLQEMYDVRIDISRAKLLCKVSGLNENVERVVTAINSLEVAKANIDLVEKRVLFHILGKGRQAFQNLVEEHSVDVQLTRDSSPPAAVVVGAKPGVEAVTAALKRIVEENREIEEEMSCEKHVVLDAIIGARGSIISQMQRDFNVRLTVNKERTTTTHAIIEIKGNVMNVNLVKEHLSERIKAYQSDTVVIDIPNGLLPGLLGKKGSRITALRKKHPDVSIDVLGDSNSIRFHSSEPIQRLSAVDEVEKYIAANMQKDFPMNKSTTITLKGAKGAEARKHLMESLHLNIDIDTEGEVIHLRGRIPDIDQGIQYLTLFCEDNYEEVMDCSHEDAGSLLNGKELSPSRSIEKKFGINIYYSRKNDIFRLVGQRDSVDDAKRYIEDFLEGSVENSALVSITPSGIGALVGRGGNHIKSFEEKHNVHVDILKPREQVRIHGCNAYDVETARLDLLKFLDNLIVNAVIENMEEVWAGRCDTIKCSLDELLTKTEKLYGVGMNRIEKIVNNDASIDDGDGRKMQTNVTFFGTPRRANAAKEFVLEEISGTTTAHLNVLNHHFEQLSTQENLTKLEQCTRGSSVSVSLNDDMITISGPIDCVAKTKVQINRLLDFLFTGEFSSVVADSRSLLALWNFETELNFRNQVTGGEIAFDVRMSCIRIYAATSISHTLGVEYIRNAIAEYKKRLITLEVNKDVFDIITAKKSVYFGPIKSAHSCKLVAEVNQVVRDDDESGECTPEYSIILEGPTQIEAQNGEAAMRAIIERLEKENWKISLKGDTVGALIGKGGNRVKELREKTKAMINIDMRTGVVEVSGNEDQVNDAKSRILEFVAIKERESHVTYVPITSDCIPRIIGTKGATIRELQTSTQAVSIDIDRAENVVMVKGSPESGQQAKDQIIALLKKDNIDITKLRYITPEEKKAVLRKKEEDEQVANKVKSVEAKSTSSSKVNTRDMYQALLNKPGISKNSLRRLRRKIREEEEQNLEEEHESTCDQPEGKEFSTSQPFNHEDNISDDSDDSEESPSSVIDSAFSFKASPDVGHNSALETSTNLPPKTDVDKAVPTPTQVAVPSGAAGNLLSMILGTTPVTASANRLCSPRAMSSGGFNHGAIGSGSKPLSVSTSNSMNGFPQSTCTSEDVGSSYYKSKTGRTIRLN